jgi:hypothetical protein
MLDKQPGWYITEPVKQADDLLDAKEGIYDKIKSFMAGPQKAIYDEARAFLANEDANLAYVDMETPAKIRSALNKPDCFKGTAIQSLKSDLLSLKEKVDLKVLDERKAVKSTIDDIRNKITRTDEFRALSPENQDKIQQRIDRHAEGLDRITGIAVLRDRANGVQRHLMPEMLAEIAALSRPAPSADNDQRRGMGETPQKPLTPPPAYVNATDIKVDYNETYIANEADLDRYLEELKKTLLTELRAGKKVIV